MTNTLSDEALDLLFREARSYNGWLDKDVSDEQIHAIYELLKMGPTSANQQPGRFVWCKSQDSRERLASHASEGNRQKILDAPVCVIIGYDLDFHEQLPWLFPHTDAKSWFAGDADARKESAFRNSVLQGAYLMLAARALGLDCGPMSGFDQDATTKEFFADQPRYRADWLCSIGYGDRSTIFDRSPRPEFDTFNKLL
ncbi:malonic semialdehyde reductase [Erythrobacter arachoides]|uniref:Putative NADH dehydrogenase/NAD(P)H nitroreductase GRI62_08805 n=1 Tax=Aurantiacibacter arachoides TaxID=1850444 RepID=A0A845A1X4_9SPHN|nr:malonic semialdehyde reductase [Aurantiacibacter arachoides]MXO93704.1 malonic semialdehyde reductase [Aurantiacibacter arachoides]GGD47290.1 putative NADH dehydrogenase/NAD(P)H nitroreductase [Aurantiacibacter arachoides]